MKQCISYTDFSEKNVFNGFSTFLEILKNLTKGRYFQACINAGTVVTMSDFVKNN